MLRLKILARTNGEVAKKSIITQGVVLSKSQNLMKEIPPYDAPKLFARMALIKLTERKVEANANRSRFFSLRF
jgi:hypothetical protein